MLLLLLWVICLFTSGKRRVVHCKKKVLFPILSNKSIFAVTWLFTYLLLITLDFTSKYRKKDLWLLPLHCDFCKRILNSHETEFCILFWIYFEHGEHLLLSYVTGSWDTERWQLNCIRYWFSIINNDLCSLKCASVRDLQCALMRDHGDRFTDVFNPREAQ